MAASSQVFGVGTDAVRQLIPSDDAGGSAPRPAATPSSGGDPLSGQQWDKARMDATASGSYAVQRGRRDVVVAVLDTGADTSHPDIGPNLDLARSRSFVPSEPDVQDHNGHGTWCLSAVAAPLNGIGIAGVAPNVTTLALKVLDRNGDGSFSGIAQALVYAADQHVDVASLSLGAFVDRKADKVDYELLRRAVGYAHDAGVLPVAAVGNDDLDLSDKKVTDSLVELPADLPGVVVIAGFDGRLWRGRSPNWLAFRFPDSARGKENPKAAGEDGLIVMQAIYAGYASAGEGRKVQLPFSAKGIQKPIDLWFRGPQYSQVRKAGAPR